MHGPVGPTIVVDPDGASAVVNGVQMSVRNVFSLGVDVPELGISAYGLYGKRGDGLPVCKGCGYHLCSCATKASPEAFQKLQTPEPIILPPPIHISGPPIHISGSWHFGVQGLVRLP